MFRATAAMQGMRPRPMKRGALWGLHCFEKERFTALLSQLLNTCFRLTFPRKPLLEAAVGFLSGQKSPVRV